MRNINNNSYPREEQENISLIAKDSQDKGEIVGISANWINSICNYLISQTDFIKSILLKIEKLESDITELTDKNKSLEKRINQLDVETRKLRRDQTKTGTLSLNSNLEQPTLNDLVDKYKSLVKQDLVRCAEILTSIEEPDQKNITFLLKAKNRSALAKFFITKNLDNAEHLRITALIQKLNAPNANLFHKTVENINSLIQTFENNKEDFPIDFHLPLKGDDISDEIHEVAPNCSNLSNKVEFSIYPAFLIRSDTPNEDKFKVLVHSLVVPAD